MEVYMISLRQTSGAVCCSALLLILVGLGACRPDEEVVTFYNTYGYQSGDKWIIPFRARVYELSRRASMAESAISGLLTNLNLEEQSERDNLKFRLGELLADNESRENIRI